MNNNIFENAYFDKAYKTKEGWKAIYITCEDKDFNSHPHQLIIEDTKRIHYYNDYGKVLVKYDETESDQYDIISEWQEEINQKELDDEARDKFEEIHSNTNSVDEPHERALMKMKWFRWGYSAGYRKGKRK